MLQFEDLIFNLLIFFFFWRRFCIQFVVCLARLLTREDDPSLDMCMLMGVGFFNKSPDQYIMSTSVF